VAKSALPASIVCCCRRLLHSFVLHIVSLIEHHSKWLLQSVRHMDDMSWARWRGCATCRRDERSCSAANCSRPPTSTSTRIHALHPHAIAPPPRSIRSLSSARIGLRVTSRRSGEWIARRGRRRAWSRARFGRSTERRSDHSYDQRVHRTIDAHITIVYTCACASLLLVASSSCRLV
jgi:hypothetical protein